MTMVASYSLLLERRIPPYVAGPTAARHFLWGRHNQDPKQVKPPATHTRKHRLSRAGPALSLRSIRHRTGSSGVGRREPQHGESPLPCPASDHCGGDKKAAPLPKEVELDESYFGGRSRGSEAGQPPGWRRPSAYLSGEYLFLLCSLPCSLLRLPPLPLQRQGEDADADHQVPGGA